MYEKTNYLPSLILFIVFALLSCEKDQSSKNCDANDPTEELTWLKQSIEEIEHDDTEMAKYSYYMSATYQNDIVFYYGNCHPLINYVSYVLDCEGKEIGYTSDLYNELSNHQVLWQHQESECNFNI